MRKISAERFNNVSMAIISIMIIVIIALTI